MESTLLSLSKIFTERLFRIPDYQRGYSWTEKQIKEYFNDLMQLEKDKNHYTGVLTLENVGKTECEFWEDDLWIIDSKSYSPYYIVDGQQRLTTSIILIQAILEITENEEKLNFTSLIDIRKKFIFDSKDDGLSRSYIFGYEKDNPSYEYLKTEIFNESSETIDQKQETIYTLNLEKAKKYFMGQLQDLNISEIEIIYKKLTQNFLFNIYTITNDIDVFVAFETMNNRGKPLSHLELLKNRLIYLSTKLNVDKYDKNSLRKRINECWKTIYHNLGRNKENPLDDDTFLLTHFGIYFFDEVFENEDIRRAHIRRFRNYRIRYSDYLLETHFTTKNLSNGTVDTNAIDNYVKSLQVSVVTWYKIFNPKKSNYAIDVKKWLDKLNRQDMSQIAPLLIVSFDKVRNNVKRIELLQTLERYNFFISLYRRRYLLPDSYDMNFIELAHLLKDKKIGIGEIIKKINDVVNLNISIIEIDSSFLKDFKDRGFYNWDGIRYFLFEYDLYLEEKSKSSRRKLIWEDFNNEDYNTVEHIYPQNSRQSCWLDKFKKHTPKQRKILKHSLGNLLPLSKQKNSSVGNKCFQEKISNENNTVGYRFGCYSENEITEYKDWDAEAILERGIKLLKFMESRWNIKIGKEKDKIKFLNLSFVRVRKKSSRI